MTDENIHYLNFASDLKRVALCLLDQSFAQAKVFAHHADKIYRSGLKLDSFPIAWQPLYRKMDKMADREASKLADKFLTLSSIIILRKS